MLTDRTTTIRASVQDVQFELMLTVGLVVMVIFLFLRSLSATVIPSVAVPLSLVGTFGVMYLLGYSLNNLSLMALTISTGFVVDDAIVMIENIARYIEDGRCAPAGGAQGLRADRLHHPFADRLADRGADPAAVHGRHRRPAVPRVRRHPGRHHPGLGGGVADPHADDVRQAAAPHAREASRAASTAPRSSVFDAHDSSLRHARCAGCCEHQTATLLVAVATLVAHDRSLRRRAEGLLPGAGHRRDPGHLRGAADASRSPRWRSGSRRWRRSILQDPAVESLSSFIGVDGTNTTLNSGRIQINLKPLEERSASASDVIRRLQPQLAQVEGITLFMQPVQDLTVEDRVSRTQFQYSLEDARRRRAAHLDAALARQAADAAGAARRRQRPAERRPRGQPW